MRRLLAALGATAVLVVVLAVGVLPTRTYLDQRRQLEQAQQRVRLLDIENQRLAARVEKLHSDTEIERLAREQYNLVHPGEEAYSVLPAPLPPVDLPSIWPFGPLGGEPEGAPDQQ